MNGIDLNALERMARAAGTNSGLGTWDATDCIVWFPDGDAVVEIGHSDPRPVGVTFANVGAWPGMIDESQVADFIAAVCPDNVIAMIAKIRALEAERDALRKDAERYQWLRNCAHSVDWNVRHPSSSWSTVTTSYCRIDGPTMDDNIDASIAAKEQK